MTWSALTGADAASFTLSGSTLSFAGVSNYETKQSYSVSVTATDAAGNATTRPLTINITDGNDAPVNAATVGRQIAGVNQPFALDLSTYFSDPDILAGGANMGWHILTYALTSGTLPAWATLNASSGVISGTPTATSALGSYTVTATDGGGLSVSQTFQLQVAAQVPAIVTSPLLVTHSSAAGNVASAATAASTFVALPSAGNGIAFSNVNATQFGNTAAAFADSSTGYTDYFWWDPVSGTQKLITHNSSAGNTASSQTVASSGLTVSADGSGAAFVTTMPIQFGNNGVAFTDTLNANGQNKLIWWNASTGTQQLVTHDNTAGYTTSALSSAASLVAIASTGSGLLFQGLDVSTLGNTATGRFTDANTGVNDLVWWDKATGTLKLVTHGGVSTTGSLAQTAATYQGMSADGSSVVFQGLNATKYGNGGTTFTDSQTATADLIWWDNASGTQYLINHSAVANTDTTSQVAPTYLAIMPDASGALFSMTNASYLGNNGVGFTAANTTTAKLFYWDKATGAQTLIDHSSLSGNTNSAATAASTLQATASDGSAVVFSNTNATQFGNYVGGSATAFTDANTGITDLFWWDKGTGVERLITHSSATNNLASAASNAVTFDGIAANSAGVVFESVDARQFGNVNVAFGDSSPAATDLFWWNQSDATQLLITHGSATNTSSAASAASGFDAIASDGSGVVFHNPDATKFGNVGAVFTDAGMAASDLFWWDKTTGAQQLITHSAGSTTASAATTSSAFVAALPDHSVIFSNVDASKFGDSNGAFLDSNTSATDYFLWDATTGNVRLLTEGAPDASSGATYVNNGVSADGNWLYLSTPNVGLLPGTSGSPMTDASITSNDVLAVRLSLLDLVTAYDNGASAYDNVTSLRNIQLNGFVNANESVILKDNGAQVAAATADANGVAVFDVTAAAGTHVYTLYDSATSCQITLAAGDWISRAAKLTVMGV